MNKKIISLISAAALMVSAMPMTGMAILESEEKAVAKSLNISFNENSYTFLRNNISRFDINGNTKIDIDDYQVIRDRINALYKDSNYDNTVAGFAVGDSQELDVDGDDDIDTADYCCLLSFIQRKFDFVVNPDDTLEDYAIITNYKNKFATSVTIPTEVYLNGTIYPVMEISDNAFKDMTNLREVIIKDFRQPEWIDKFNRPIGPNSEGDAIKACNYVKINDLAFKGCTNLDRIELPDHVTFSKDAFKYSGLRSHFNTYDEDEISYFTSDNNKIVACGPKYYVSTPSLELKKGTTAISEGAFSGKNITDVSIPETVKFIGNGAFSDCKKLVSLKHGDNVITHIKRGDKNIVTRYLSAFNSTKLACDSADAEAENIVTIIKDNIGYTGNGELTPEQQRAAIKELVKYFYENVYYRGFSRHGVFTTDRYNVEDYDRGSVYNACGGFLLSSTECEGFSYAASIVLDKLGIQNFSTGSNNTKGYGHAFNIAFVDGRWYYVDLSADGERENQEINGNIYKDKEDLIDRIDEVTILREMEKNWHIASRPEFQMFESSKYKQFGSGSCNISYTSDKRVLIIEADSAYLKEDQIRTLEQGILKGNIKYKSTFEPGMNWMIVNDEWRCYDQNGILQVNEWIPYGDNEYYVDREGNVVYDQWVSVSNNVYGYVNNVGIRVNELMMINNKVYRNGVLQTAPFHIGDKYFNVASDGQLIAD